MTRKRHRQ